MAFSGKADRHVAAAYANLPLSFEENLGRTAREVKFVFHGSGYELFLTPQEAVLALHSTRRLDLSPTHRMAYFKALVDARKAEKTAVVRMRLVNANPSTKVAGMDPVPDRVDYFLGNDPSAWRTNVRSYNRVKYANVYPGVDLVFYGNQRRLEYDFIVAPGADPKAIALDVEGAQELRVNSHGDLLVAVQDGQVQLQKPLLYQQINGQRREIAGAYTIANLRFGLAQQTPGWHFTEFARIDNIGNRAYVGSVIVNETNLRFFEPEPGRTFDLMFTVACRDCVLTP